LALVSLRPFHKRALFRAFLWPVVIWGFIVNHSAQKPRWQMLKVIASGLEIPPTDIAKLGADWPVPPRSQSAKSDV
jgi:hypothetical protein